jgi:tetratricopeptide (TPR) repeat protein
MDRAMDREWRSAAARWSFGIGCFGVALSLARFLFAHERYELIYLPPLLFLIGLVVVWKPLFALATKPLIAFVDSLFFPGGKLEKPVLNLKLPAYYLSEGRYEEALAEYRKILRHYPDVAEAYEQAIWIEAVVNGSPQRAAKLLRRARRRRVEVGETFARLCVAVRMPA